MKKEIDYKVKGKKRVRCPKCGNLGVLIKYSDGSEMMQHKVSYGKLGKFIVPEITKSCVIKWIKE